MPADTVEIKQIRGYQEQLYVSKFKNSDEIDKF